MKKGNKTLIKAHEEATHRQPPTEVLAWVDEPGICPQRVLSVKKEVQKEEQLQDAEAEGGQASGQGRQMDNNRLSIVDSAHLCVSQSRSGPVRAQGARGDRCPCQSPMLYRPTNGGRARFSDSGADLGCYDKGIPQDSMSERRVGADRGYSCISDCEGVRGVGANLSMEAIQHFG